MMSRATTVSRPVVLAAALWAVLGGVRAATAQEEGLPPVEGRDTKAAREAYALLLDNQVRSVRIAEGWLDRIPSGSSGTRKLAARDRYIMMEARGEITAANRSLDVTSDLANLAEELGSPEAVVGNLRLMIAAQREILAWIGGRAYSTHSKTSVERTVRRAEQEFARAEGALSAYLTLTPAEKSLILSQYRSQLYQHGDGPLLGSMSAEDLAAGRPAERPMSREEYRRKQQEYEEWLAEQERREQERLRLEQERRSAVGKRQRQEPGEMPKVGLAPPKPPPSPSPPPPPPTPQERMEAWHRYYQGSVLRVKLALRQYLEARDRVSVVRRACAKLSQTAADLLADEKALAAPDPAVGEALRRAIGEFHRGSEVCLASDPGDAKGHFAAGEKALAQAATALAAYSLQP